MVTKVRKPKLPTTTTVEKSETIFTRMANRSFELDKLGQQYLDTLPPLPRNEAADRLVNAANRIFSDANKDWNNVPDYVATIVDGHVPYYFPPRNGSLHYALGFSLVSQEAHLRNLLEIAEGRTTKELDFPVAAELEA